MLSEKIAFENKFNHVWNSNDIYGSIKKIRTMFLDNEEIFWLAICTLYHSFDSDLSIDIKNKLYNMAISELARLNNVGFIKKIHLCIMNQYGINLSDLKTMIIYKGMTIKSNCLAAIYPENNGFTLTVFDRCKVILEKHYDTFSAAKKAHTYITNRHEKYIAKYNNH